MIPEEIVKKKNIQTSQFSYLDIIQHIGIKSSATEHKFTELDVVQIQANANQDNMSDQGDDAEEKSEASLEDLHVADGQQTLANKKTKVLFASLSPSGMQLAIACEDNTVALMTVMTSSSEHKQSKFLFWPKYKKLSRNSGNAKIVHLSWSLVEEVESELSAVASGNCRSCSRGILDYSVDHARQLPRIQVCLQLFGRIQ